MNEDFVGRVKEVSRRNALAEEYSCEIQLSESDMMFAEEAKQRMLNRISCKFRIRRAYVHIWRTVKVAAVIVLIMNVCVMLSLATSETLRGMAIDMFRGMNRISEDEWTIKSFDNTITPIYLGEGYRIATNFSSEDASYVAWESEGKTVFVLETHVNLGESIAESLKLLMNPYMDGEMKETMVFTDDTAYLIWKSGDRNYVVGRKNRIIDQSWNEMVNDMLKLGE